MDWFPYDNGFRHEKVKKSIILQFNYCSLVWMFRSKQLNNGINSLQEMALRVTYQDRYSSFSELLDLDKSVSIHYRNIKFANGNM